MGDMSTTLHLVNLAAFSFLPAGVDSAWRFYTMGALSVVLFGAAKAGFGGVAAISTPLMIYACGGNATLAAAIMLPLLIMTDYVAMVVWWRKWDRRNLLRLLPGALAGVVVGTAVLWLLLRAGGQDAGSASGNHKKFADAGLSLLIGLIALAFVGLQLWRAVRGQGRQAAPKPWQSSAMGLAAGLTSTISHSAGPVVTMFLLPQQMSKSAFVSTMVIFFWIINQVKLLPYGMLGMLGRPSLAADLLLAPAVVGGVLLGIVLHNHISQKWFNRVVYVLLAAIGAHLSIASAWQLAGH
jgi:hypothetical protein